MAKDSTAEQEQDTDGKEERLYHAKATLDEESLAAVEEIRDAVVAAGLPEPVKRADSDEIIVHPGIEVEGEMGDDLRQMLEWHQSNWVGEQSQHNLEPARVAVKPGGKLVDYVSIEFRNGMESTRMSQAAEVAKHGAENVLFPNGTEIVLAYVDEDVEGALGPFDRVAEDDPNGVLEWAEELDTEQLEAMLPDRMGLAETVIEERESPWNNDG